MIESKPKVSIIIPVYNGSNYVEAAIQSALQQTYDNIEIIVVNDGSTDDEKTEKIVLSFGDRLKYISKKNGGVASALNAAIKHMTGDYCSWLSHDDLYLPDKIEKQIDAIINLGEGPFILYSDYEIFTNHLAKGNAIKMDGVHPDYFRYWLTVKNCLHGCTLLIPKSAFQNVGIFDESLKTTQDYDLWFRFAKVYKFIHLPEVLVQARSHPEQDSLKKVKIVNTECDSLMTNFINDLSPEEIIGATHKSLSVSYEIIATTMRMRGFLGAAQVCDNLAKQHQDKRDIISHHILFIFRKIKHLLMGYRKVILQWLPHPLKMILKNIFQGKHR